MPLQQITTSQDAVLFMLGFMIQVLGEEAVSTIDEISETKVLRDTEVGSLFVSKTAAE